MHTSYLSAKVFSLKCFPLYGIRVFKHKASRTSENSSVGVHESIIESHCCQKNCGKIAVLFGKAQFDQASDPDIIEL